nr:hypothetical protein [Caballeronia sp. INDeC2]
MRNSAGAKRREASVVLINNEFEIGYLVVVFALLGVILIGALLTALHLDRWHPKLIGAAIGALLGLALIEAVPMLT